MVNGWLKGSARRCSALLLARSPRALSRASDALGYYHERRDADRKVGLGPEHSWACDAADAFGLMAICYEEPSRVAGFGRKLNYPKLGIA